jgi:2-C-methyl-D-erythritol 4-phosphate cytidylyltransferase
MPLKLPSIFSRNKNNTKHCCSVVVAAAGSSARMEGLDKLLLPIGGKPVLAHTLAALEECDEIGEIIVVTRRDKLDEIARLVRKYLLNKVNGIIVGGETRLESVYKGVQAVSSDSKLIAVHDGARPFVTEDIVSAAVAAALKFSAAAPAVPVTSTVKRAHNGIVLQTVDRNELYEIQTPQVFTAELLKGALQNAVDKKLYITDDCMAVEALGVTVHLTQGARENIKLTTSFDIAIAESILRMRGNQT